jgi:monoamine oxidase
MRGLDAAGVKNSLLFELDEEVGGTSRGGQAPLSAHPWGAHYITVPMAENRPLVRLLEEVGSVTGRASDGEPEIAEQDFAHDPAERLFYRGRWYEGLYPMAGASSAELAEKSRFEAEIDRWVAFRDAEGKRAFVLPMSRASRDERVRALDSVSMLQWLDRNNYSSTRLRWWVEYACRDDYGTGLADTSAWSVFLYYASRKREAGGDYQEVVTWPEGNARLVRHLRTPVSARIRANHAVARVQNDEQGVRIHALHAEGAGEPKVVGIRARYAIMATPQFINARVVRDLEGERLAAVQSFQQSPWMVANLHLSARPAGPGFPLSWDNVIYESPALGYVVATHQSGPDRGPTVLTYYYPLTDSDPRVGRRRLLELGWREWSEVLLSDLERAHPRLRDSVQKIDIARWGHGMVRSSPGRIWDGTRELAAQPVGRVHFAHSDLSGVALFEEAFDRGLQAAEQVVQRLRATPTSDGATAERP